MPSSSAGTLDAAPRLAILSYSTGEFDARTQRIARSAVDAGWHVTVYARWRPGLPEIVEEPGYRLVRVPTDLLLAIPGLRGRRRRRLMARRTALSLHGRATGSDAPLGSPGNGGFVDRVPDRLRGTLLSPFFRGLKAALRRHVVRRRSIVAFPLRPIAWAVALEDAVEAADLWHGMWAGSLPALGRLRRRYGGRALYDSRDVYLHSREFERMGRIRRGVLLSIERRWARAADAVLTVNDAYADILAQTLRIARPAVVMNCPARWTRPEPPPDRIRGALGLPATIAVVLYQGNFISERGIEQAMDAILGLPDAALILLGYGGLGASLTSRSTEPPYAGRVFVLPPVPPNELLEWTASSDVMVMAIQPTTLNHRYTTPQKLFEAMAAGVPVVASDLPGMAEIVNATDAGVLCDPTSPASIAEGIRSMLEQSPAELAAMRERARKAADETYNWDRQVTVLFEVYGRLLGGRPS